MDGGEGRGEMGRVGREGVGWGGRWFDKGES